MKLARVGAVLLALQGAFPALVFGLFRPGGWFILLFAAIYGLFAWGVWAAKRWVLILAIVFTLPQLFVISSNFFSWQFYIGGAFGPGVAPMSSLLNTRIIAFYSVGARFDFAVSEYCPSLLAGFPSFGSKTFVLLNVFALGMLTILIAIIVRTRSESAKTSTPPKINTSPVP